MLAGLTVALTLIPQSIAYAEIAGLQPQVSMLHFRNMSI
jgi:MFS superfamily sulfate permease-like transporter